MKTAQIICLAEYKAQREQPETEFRQWHPGPTIATIVRLDAVRMAADKDRR